MVVTKIMKSSDCSGGKGIFKLFNSVKAKLEAMVKSKKITLSCGTIYKKIYDIL